MVTAAQILWTAAGSPTLEQARDRVDLVGHEGLCWWCGMPAPGEARHIRRLPDTFPWPLEPAAESEHLCICCAWTLCDRVSLPSEYAAARIQAKAQQGRRQVLSIRGEDLERVLILHLDSGSVGIWDCGPNAAAEKPWQLAIADLRGDPMTVGPCIYREAVSYSDISTGPVEKFRAYHHFGRLGADPKWWVCTDSDRAAIREWLVCPPEAEWCGVIGDGKKHYVIQAGSGVNSGADGLLVVHYLGSPVLYEPQELTAQIAAVEALIAAGAGDDEIASGHYSPRGATLTMAVRQYDPMIEPIRGGPAMGLVLYLRRNRKELTC